MAEKRARRKILADAMIFTLSSPYTQMVRLGTLKIQLMSQTYSSSGKLSMLMENRNFTFQIAVKQIRTLGKQSGQKTANMRLI